MEIKIKGKEYSIKYTLRALFIYESITGAPFKIETITDQYILVYSIILANIQDINLTFDDFVDECETNPELFIGLLSFVEKEIEKQQIFNKHNSDNDSKKKN